MYKYVQLYMLACLYLIHLHACMYVYAYECVRVLVYVCVHKHLMKPTYGGLTCVCIPSWPNLAAAPTAAQEGSAGGCSSAKERAQISFWQPASSLPFLSLSFFILIATPSCCKSELRRRQ